MKKLQNFIFRLKNLLNKKANLVTYIKNCIFFSEQNTNGRLPPGDEVF